MRRKLGELLIEAGAATLEDVEAALADQAAGEPSRLGDLLLSSGKVTAAAIARALAVQLGLPFADLAYVAPEASALIPLEFQRAHRLVLFRLDRDGGATRVHIALSDPSLTDVVAELRSQLKREVIIHVAPIDDIESVLAALSGESGEEPVVMGEVLEEEEEFVTAEPEPSGEDAFAVPDSPGGFTDSENYAPPAGDPFDFFAPASAPAPIAFSAPPAVQVSDGNSRAPVLPALPIAHVSDGAERAPLPVAEASDGFDSDPLADLPVVQASDRFDFAAALDVHTSAANSERAEFLFGGAPDPESGPPMPVSPELPDSWADEVSATAATAPSARAAPVEVAPPPAIAAPEAAPASVTEEELFGSLDLGAPAEVAPLSTDLADEIGRHDLAPPRQDFVGFSGLSAPLGDPAGGPFGARESSPSPVQPPTPEPSAPVPPPSAPDLFAPALEVTAPESQPAPALEAPAPQLALEPDLFAPATEAVAPDLASDLFADPTEAVASDLASDLFVPSTEAVAPALASDLVAPATEAVAPDLAPDRVAPPTEAVASDLASDLFGPATEEVAPDLSPDLFASAPEAPAPKLEPQPLLDAEVTAPASLDLPNIVPAPLISPLLDLGPISHEPTQKFGGVFASSEPPRIPSFAIPPEVPVESRRSPVEPLRRPATLGRIALKRVAVNRDGVRVPVPPAVTAPAPPPEPPPPPAPQVIEELPEWMRSSADAAPVVAVLAPVDAGELSARLIALLERIETGALPTGPALAAMLRLLVERRVIDDAALAAALEKL